MFNNSDELLKFIKDERVEMVDVRFCDLPGVMQHFTVPVSSFDQSVFDDGLGCSWSGTGPSSRQVPSGVVCVIIPVSRPIRSTRPLACETPVPGSTSWYFTDEEPALMTSTACCIPLSPSPGCR